MMNVGIFSLQCLFEDVAQLLFGETGAPSGPDGFSDGAVHGLAAVGGHLLFGDLRDEGSHALPGADEAFALQEHTLEFARGLLESSAGREASDRRAALEELVDKSRGERERFDTLARKAGESYVRVLKGPVDKHHHKSEQAEADLKDANSS